MNIPKDNLTHQQASTIVLRLPTSAPPPPAAAAAALPTPSPARTMLPRPALAMCPPLTASSKPWDSATVSYGGGGGTVGAWCGGFMRGVRWPLWQHKCLTHAHRDRTPTQINPTQPNQAHTAPHLRERAANVAHQLVVLVRGGLVRPAHRAGKGARRGRPVVGMVVVVVRHGRLRSTPLNLGEAARSSYWWWWCCHRLPDRSIDRSTCRWVWNGAWGERPL